jgi:hypothetical protein
LVRASKVQRYYRPDPSLVYGELFFTYGWFEIWMSLDEMVVDVALSKVTRNTGAGLENTSQRTLLLVPKRMPLRYMLSELFGRPQSPFTFPGGTVSGAGNGSITPWRP